MTTESRTFTVGRTLVPVTDLINQRVLVVLKKPGWNQYGECEEVRVLELSPLREWVKLQRNATGQKVWHRLEDVKWIEQLFPVAPGGEPKPPHAV